MYDRILVPTDGSAAADRAIDHAVRLSRATGATIHVLSVIDRVPAVDVGGGETLVGDVSAAATRTVEQARTRIESDGVTPITATDSGVPYRRILEYADDEDVDLIVMGTRGRTGIERHLLGSVTEKVVRLSDVPVLTVRETEAEGTDA